MRRWTAKAIDGAWALVLVSTWSALGCAPPPSEEATVEVLTASGQPLASPLEPAAPEAPRFSDCPDGWTAQGEGASLQCRPDWSVEAPRLTGCPSGWELRSVGVKDPRQACLPAAPQSCPAGERRDLASAKCVAVGTACPTDSQWATPPSNATQVLYVLPGGTGDGTEASPFGSIEAAIAVASPSAVVLLAAGEYTTTASIGAELTILGACAPETRIVGTAAPVPDANLNEDFQGALHVHDQGKLTLENVTLSGERTAVTVRGGGAAAVSNVFVDDFTPQGLWVADEGSTLSVSKSLFSGGRIGAPGRTVAPGVSAAFGGHAEVSDTAFVHSVGRAVAVLQGASAVLTDVSMTDVDVGAADTSSPVYLNGGSELEAHRLHVSEFYGQAVAAIGSTAQLSWIAVEHGVSSGSNAQTVGLRLLEGASLSCTSCVIRDVQGFGVASPSDARADLALTDVLIAELGFSADETGAGISTDNTDVTLERVQVLDVPGSAIRIVNGQGSLTDVRVVDAGTVHDDRGGVSCSEGSYLLRRVSAEGMSLGVMNASYTVEEVLATGWTEVLQEGHPFFGLVLEGQGTARRVHVAQSYGYGLKLGAGTHDVSGVVVEDLKPLVTEALDMGLGIAVATDAAVEGKNWVTRRISGYAVLAWGALSLEDALIADTLERRDGAFGIGVHLLNDTNLSRVRIERTFGAGLFTSGATATLQDVAIVDTRSGRIGGLYGQGLAAQSSKLDATRLSIDGAQSAGLFADASDVTLRDALVTGISPGSAFHDGGEGLWVTGSSQATLERVAVKDVFGAGLGVSQGAVVQAEELAIQNVQPGRALLKDVFGVQVAEGVADCILVAEDGEGTFTRTSLADCGRSGLLLQRATARLEEVEIRNAPVGVATQYAELPEHDATLLYFEGVGSPSVRDPGYGVPSGPPVGGSGEDMRFDDLFLEEEQ